MISVALASLASGVSLLPVGPAFAESTSVPSAHYSVETTLVGKLLDDPAAAAVIKDLAPTVYSNEQFQAAGRALPLKEIQQYEPDALSNEVLAKIQAAFDKLPMKN
jgi:para-nitrobenzyl esterase